MGEKKVQSLSPRFILSQLHLLHGTLLLHTFTESPSKRFACHDNPSLNQVPRSTEKRHLPSCTLFCVAWQKEGLVCTGSIRANVCHVSCVWFEWQLQNSRVDCTEDFPWKQEQVVLFLLSIEP